MTDAPTTRAGRLRIETRTGDAIAPVMPALSLLRAAVFRAWPYLYEGDGVYEADYGSTYLRSPRAAIVIAWDGTEPVGAATCLPLADETANISAPFAAHGIDIAGVCYFGESVLRPAWRGEGAGVAFFAHREAHARACGFDIAAFCAVDRAADDPRRPADAAPLDGFWRNRGFRRAPHLACTMRWREIGHDEESEHTLTFWLKSLHGAPP